MDVGVKDNRFAKWALIDSGVGREYYIDTILLKTNTFPDEFLCYLEPHF